MPQISHSSVQTLILPKIHSHQDLDYVSDTISSSSRDSSRRNNLQIVSSIESARGIWNLGSIAGWKPSHNPQVGGELSAILVRFVYSSIREETYMRAVCSRRLWAACCLPCSLLTIVKHQRLRGHIRHPHQLTLWAAVCSLSNSHCCKSLWAWFNWYGLLRFCC